MYLIEELGVEQSRANFWSGLVFSVSFLISGVMAPIWGAMADKRSRKLMALRAAILLAVSYALGGIVQNEWQLLAMRCFQGFASGLWPACLAIMASTVPRERIGLAMGIMQGGMTAGGVLGPFFGGALAELFSMRMTFFIGGAALAVITLLILFFIHEPPRKEQKKAAGIAEPKNLEEQAISLIGTDIYEKLVKGYTEKQWGRPCSELPAFIIRRIPFRFIFDNNYFNDPYQGIPMGGYNRLIGALLENIEVRTGTDYMAHRKELDALAEKVLYTGCIDEYFDYACGHLEYRSLRFEHRHLTDIEDFQGNAVVNYTDRETPYTRVIEHKHFEFGKQRSTVITYEYPDDFEQGKEPYYPVNDEKNNLIFKQYQELAQQQERVLFGGRLAQYTYADMDDTVAAALKLWKKESL